MSPTKSDEQVTRFRPDELARLIHLSDMIFALSMTVMVLMIEVPEPGALDSYEAIRTFVLEQLRNFAVYVVSFVLIAIYWMRHLDRFRHYRSTQTPHVWRQLGFLAMIAVIPFSSTFASNYPNHFTVEAFYSLNMVAVGLFAFAEWHYATKHRRLVSPDLDEATVREVRAGALTEPIVALVALGVAAIREDLWEPTFLLAPLLFSLQRRVRAWHAKRRASG